jgi:hypothetical protein
MKKIQSLSVWFNGQQIIVDTLLVILTNDDLSTSATFTYLLGVESGNPIIPFQSYADGTVFLAGQEYENWDNSNEQAYELVAQKLNLTII